MSAQLGSQALAQANFGHAVSRQLCTSVPLIPQTIHLEGKNVLVTGSNVGLGLECTRHFLRLRPRLLIMGVRSLSKGEAAAASLRKEFPDAEIQVWEIDMESFRSVQAFAARCVRDLDRVHVAVLNAGVAKQEFEQAEERSHREISIQVNYLSTALLTILLLPKLRPTTSSLEPGRLSIVSSDLSLKVKLEESSKIGILDSLDRPEVYDSNRQYATSKLLITMFVAKLADIVSPSQVIINAVNPGATKGTSFFREVDSWIVRLFFRIFFGIVGRSPMEASRAYLHACLVLGCESHGSFVDWQVRAWPITMYTNSGRTVSEKLWNETMNELSFVDPELLLDSSREGINKS